MSNIRQILSEYIHEQRKGTDISHDQDRTYTFVDINPHTVWDSDKAVVTFEGGFYDNVNGVYGGTHEWVDVTARMYNHEQIRISSRYYDGASPTFWFVGRWRITEIYDFGRCTDGMRSIQSGVIHTPVVTGNPLEHEDLAYYDIDLTHSPYTPVDPDKTIPIFQGSIFISPYGRLDHLYGDYQAISTTARLVDDGETLRISAAYGYMEDSLWVTGHWQLMESY